MNKKIISIIAIVILIILGLVYTIGWIYPVSSGKRSGKLVKTSKKGKLIKTCEGTLDLGSGDQLTWNFSVKDDDLCDRLIENNGEFITLEYKETFLKFPRDTKYQVTEMALSSVKINNNNLLDLNQKRNNTNYNENKDAFCSLLGSIYSNQKVYLEVKSIVKEKNLYLYKKIETCNN